MQELKKIIGRFLKKNGLEKGVNQNKALLIWEEIVGNTIADNTSPEKVEHGILTVKTKNSSWRQELLFKKQEIIEKLNKSLGDNTIKEIKFI
jgi:predicted nucleic acid-binding Zn ribbon protein|tara:strand:- start:138 stop:413 length:276 start_codon:yes stop_codon:yes gene_type:complete